MVSANRTPDGLSDAINNFLVDFAMQTGYTTELDEDQDDEGRPVYLLTPNANDCVYAARQPVAIAAVLFDLCGRMGVTPPRAITAALTDEPPF